MKRLGIIWTIGLGLAVASVGALANAACAEVGFRVVELHATPDTRAVKAGDKTLFVHRDAITRTSDISDIKLVNGDDDDAIILIKFTPAADQRLHDLTTNHAGLRLAFLFDDEVLINIVWEGPYGMDTGGGQLSMRHGMSRAQRLMRAIRGCTAANGS